MKPKHEINTPPFTKHDYIYIYNMVCPFAFFSCLSHSGMFYLLQVLTANPGLVNYVPLGSESLSDWLNV